MKTHTTQQLDDIILDAKETLECEDEPDQDEYVGWIELAAQLAEELLLLKS